MNRRNKHWVIGGGLLVLIIAGLLIYYFVWSVSNAIRLPVVENCGLHLEPCSAPLPTGGRIVFEINPRQPAPSETLYLSADFEGVEPRAVGVRFKGINMNMGQLEYYVHHLSRKDTLDDSISFTGSGGVFVCSIGTMQWLVLVNLQIGGRVYEVPFRFETINYGN